MFDGFRIDGLLGRGATGAVYAAWDLAHGRPAAVKILGAAIADPREFARFQREAETVARLRHPGIVELYQMGQTEDFCYLAMQWVRGATLRECLDQGSAASGLAPGGSGQPRPAPERPALTRTVRLNTGGSPVTAREDPPGPNGRASRVRDPRYVRQSAEMLRDLADSLAHAHGAGVTHRDLKPENVMVGPDGRVVIIDFGLARSFADSTLSSHSGLVGTPLYMAPEQLRGQPAGPHTDVYALGLIGYELLTLSLPYRARTIEGLLGEVLHKPTPPLTGRNPAAPTALADIVHRAMAKDPARRYPSAAELRADLERYLAGARVSARPYRYRFDGGEVALARPRLVEVGGLLNLFLGWFLAFVSVVLGLEGKSILPCLPLAGLFLAAGLGFRSGCLLGQVLAGLGAVLGGALAVAVMLADFEGKVTAPLILSMEIGLLGTAATTTLALTCPRCRLWFRRMRAKRQEFEADRR